MESPTTVPFETHYVADKKTAGEMTRVSVINMMTARAFWLCFALIALIPILLGLSGGYSSTYAGSWMDSDHVGRTSATLGEYVTTFVVTLIFMAVVTAVIWAIAYLRFRKMMASAFYPSAQLSIRFDAEGFDQHYPNLRSRGTYNNVTKVFRRGGAVVLKQRSGLPFVVFPRELMPDNAIELVKRGAGLT